MNNSTNHIEHLQGDTVILQGYPEELGINGMCVEVLRLCAILPTADGGTASMYIVRFGNGMVRRAMGENLRRVSQQPALAADFSTVVPWASCAWAPAGLNTPSRKPAMNNKLTAVLCWAASCVVSVGMVALVVAVLR